MMNDGGSISFPSVILSERGEAERVEGFPMSKRRRRPKRGPHETAVGGVEGTELGEAISQKSEKQHVICVPGTLQIGGTL